MLSPGQTLRTSPSEPIPPVWPPGQTVSDALCPSAPPRVIITAEKERRATPVQRAEGLRLSYCSTTMPAAALQLGCCRLEGPVLIPQRGTQDEQPGHRTNSLHTGRSACTQDEQPAHRKPAHRTNSLHTGRTACTQDEQPVHRTNSLHTGRLHTGRTACTQDEQPGHRTNSLHTGRTACTQDACTQDEQPAHRTNSLGTGRTACTQDEQPGPTRRHPLSHKRTNRQQLRWGRKNKTKPQTLRKRPLKKRGETVQGRGGFTEVQKHT